jgi:Flp pilus assembly pilin Flp
MRKRPRAVSAGQHGIVAVEYALVVAVIGLLLVAACYLLFQSVSATFTGMGSCVPASLRNGNGNGIGNGKARGNGKGKAKGNGKSKGTGSGGTGC